MKRILISFDVENSAWHNRALGLQRYAPPGYQVDIARERDARPQDYEHVFWQCWWNAPPHATVLVANEGCMWPHPAPPDAPYHQRTSSKSKNLAVAKRLQPNVARVICINPKCVDFCRSLNPNTVYLRTGVDTDFWKPLKPLTSYDQMRIGWCGKPSTSTKFSPKGYGETLQPIMSLLKDDQRFKFIVNDCTERLDRKAMLRWYNSIEVFLCTSFSEGTPSTVQEAVACGRYVISTDVGIVSEISKGCEVVSRCHLPAALEKHQQQTRSYRLLQGINGSQFMREHFCWSTLAPQWIETICE